MLSFIQYISEVKLNSSGQKSDYDSNKYIKPFVSGQPAHTSGSHEVDRDIGHLKANDKVTLHAHKVIDGVHHVVVSKPGSSNRITITTNKIKKQSFAKNIGFEQEAKLIHHLNSHGLMSGTGAGATAGNDFHLIDKRLGKGKHIKIAGSEGITTTKSPVTGEHKSNLTAAFGQITLNRHPKTQKWHISDKARAKRPEYAAAVENASITVNGKKKKIIDHLNSLQGPEYKPPVRRKTAEEIMSDDHDLAPAHAYMRDHHVDVVHIDSHGTYRAGKSEKIDKHKLGLPKLQGIGRFRIRERTGKANARMVQFSVRKLVKSHTNIGTDEDAKKIKKILGHQNDTI